MTRRTAVRIVAGFAVARSEAAPEGERGLVKERDAVLCAVSGTSRDLCLFEGETVMRFPSRGAPQGGRLVGMDSVLWSDKWEKRIPIAPSSASFFADGKRLLCEIMHLPGGRRRFVLDPAGALLNEHLDPPGSRFALCSACKDDFAVGFTEAEGAEGYEFFHLDVVDWSRGKSVPFSPDGQARPQRRLGGEPRYSADREWVVHGFPPLVVMRRTNDLSVKWTHSLEDGVWPTSLAISAAGSHVAVVGRIDGAANRRRCTIHLLNGGDGREMRRLETEAARYVAISPDGGMIALASETEIDTEGSRIRTAARLVESIKGREIRRFPHDDFDATDRVRAGIVSAGLGFSSSGKQLFVSGTRRLRVWDLDVALGIAGNA